MEGLQYFYLAAVLVIVALLFWGNLVYVYWSIAEFFAKIKFNWRYRNNATYREFIKGYHKKREGQIKDYLSKAKQNQSRREDKGLW